MSSGAASEPPVVPAPAAPQPSPSGRVSSARSSGSAWTAVAEAAVKAVTRARGSTSLRMLFAPARWGDFALFGDTELQTFARTSPEAPLLVNPCFRSSSPLPHVIRKPVALRSTQNHQGIRLGMEAA